MENDGITKASVREYVAVKFSIGAKTVAHKTKSSNTRNQNYVSPEKRIEDRRTRPGV